MTTILLMIAAALGAGAVVFYWCRMRNRMDKQIVDDAGHILKEEARPEFNSTPVMVAPHWSAAAVRVQQLESGGLDGHLVIDPGPTIQMISQQDEADVFNADMLAHQINHKVA